MGRRANGEGSIYARKKDGKTIGWCGQYTDNMGKKRYLYGKTQKEVREKLDEAKKQSNMGLDVDKNKITFAEWLVEWLEVYSKPAIRKGTYRVYYNIVMNHVVPAFPKVLLKDLRADMLQKFFNDKAKSGRLDTEINPDTGEVVQKEGGLSVSILYKMRGIISNCLNQAIENNIIIHNAAQKVKLPQQPWKEVEVLSKDEQRLLEVAALKSDSPLAFAVYLDLYTGLRIGELLALKASDIDFDKNELQVKRTVSRIQLPGEGRTEIIINEPKTRKGIRTIPLPEFVADKLKRHIESNNKELEIVRKHGRDICPEDKLKWLNEDFVFISMFGKPHEQSHMRRVLDKLLREAGLRHVNFHALRHTFATRCLEKGFDIRTLADILGHGDATMTLNIYGHALTEQKRNNMDKLADIYEDEESEE